MKIEDIIRQNIVIWFLGTLLAGFLAGIAVYEAIIKISQLDVVRLDNYIKKDELSNKYVTKEEFTNLDQKYNLLLDENRRLNQLKVKNQTIPSISKDKERHIKKLKELISEGTAFYQDKEIEFDFDIWTSECTYLIEILDKTYDWNYKEKFVKETDHPRSKVFLNHQSVGKTLVILNTIYDIMK